MNTQVTHRVEDLVIQTTHYVTRPIIQRTVQLTKLIKTIICFHKNVCTKFQTAKALNKMFDKF